MANSFTMRSRGREISLRICGVIDLCAGVVLFVLGLALMLAGDWKGAIDFLGSFLVLWAGTMMTWSRGLCDTPAHPDDKPPTSPCNAERHCCDRHWSK